MRDDVLIVSAPLITTPTADVKVGIDYARIPAPVGLASAAFTSTQTLAARGQTNPTSAQIQNASTAKPRVSGRLARVFVRLGDTVKKGQAVAALDDTLLRLGVAKAEMDRKKAGLDIAVLSQNISDLEDKRQTALDARAKIYTALGTIATAKQQLATAQGTLNAGLAQIESKQGQLSAAIQQLRAGIAQVEAAIAQLEKIPPPMRPPGKLEQLKAQLAALQAQLAQAESGQASLAGALAKAQAGQGQLNSAKAKLAVGETQARAGLAQVQTGLAKIADGLKKLRQARALAKAALPIKDAAVVTARDRLAATVITSPDAGQVIQVMQPGEIVMVNAPVIKVRLAGPSRIDTYLTLAQLPLARLGTQVQVTADSLPGERLAGTITQARPVYVFPPSAFPTTEVHLLRTVPVTVTLDRGYTLPAGVPVDITFEATSGATP